MQKHNTRLFFYIDRKQLAYSLNNETQYNPVTNQHGRDPEDNMANIVRVGEVLRNHHLACAYRQVETSQNSGEDLTTNHKTLEQTRTIMQ